MNNKENNNGWDSPKKKNHKHINRLHDYFKDDNMSISENFDDFFQSQKSNFSKDDWQRFMKNFDERMKKGAAGVKPNMVVMFEDDYENLIEMRGYFKMNSKTEYVDTINKILNTLQPRDIQ
jgi:hypothetical protein